MRQNHRQRVYAAEVAAVGQKLRQSTSTIRCSTHSVHLIAFAWACIASPEAGARYRIVVSMLL